MAKKDKKTALADNLSQPYIGAQPEKPKKKRSGGMLAFLMLLGLVFVTVGAATLTIVFDIGGLRKKVVETAVGLDDNLILTEEQEKEYQAKLDALTKEQDAFDAEKALADEELEEKRKALAALEIELNQEQEERNKIPIFRQRLKSDEIEEMTSLAKTYSLMEPETAAGLLAALDSPEDAASILYFMKEASCALILEQMDAPLAAKITMILLPED